VTTVSCVFSSSDAWSFAHALVEPILGKWMRFLTTGKHRTAFDDMPAFRVERQFPSNLSVTFGQIKVMPVESHTSTSAVA